MSCQAKDCERESDDEMDLFCLEHWSMVPIKMRQQLFARWKKDADRQSKEWQEIARMAVASCLAKEKNLKRPEKDST